VACESRQGLQDFAVASILRTEQISPARLAMRDRQEVPLRDILIGDEALSSAGSCDDGQCGGSYQWPGHDAVDIPGADHIVGVDHPASRVDDARFCGQLGESIGSGSSMEGACGILAGSVFGAGAVQRTKAAGDGGAGVDQGDAGLQHGLGSAYIEALHPLGAPRASVPDSGRVKDQIDSADCHAQDGRLEEVAAMMFNA